ncbi:MAG: DUF262 domain-containing protein [Loktanella sp.]|nr:DUF262 domain-containing protein [Loktanella sp.]
MDSSKILKKFKDAQNSLVIQNSDFSLSVMREMIMTGAVDVNPHYQRRDRWPRTKQSRLIESFILNVPVPPIFLSEHEYGSYSVIDGKQRLTAINQFLGGEFALEGLEGFPELNTLKYNHLPREIQNGLVMRPYLRVTTLLNQSDPELTYEVFLRLNTGGESLTAQEIRNVAYDGPFNNGLVEASTNKLLAQALKLKAGRVSKDMSDVEMVLRFLYMNFGTIDMNFMSRGMDDFMRANKDIWSNEFEDAFSKSIGRCFDLWGKHAFNKPVADGWRSQFIAPMYDAEMHACHKLSDVAFATLAKNPARVRAATQVLFEEDVKFVKSVTQSTNNLSAIKYRLDTMRTLLQDLADE